MEKKIYVYIFWCFPVEEMKKKKNNNNKMKNEKKNIAGTDWATAQNSVTIQWQIVS